MPSEIRRRPGLWCRMLRRMGAVVLGGVLVACGNSEGEEPPAAGPSIDSTGSSPSDDFPTREPPRLLSEGEVHGFPYTLTFGGRGGGYCMALEVRGSPPERQEVCGLSGEGSDEDFGFIDVGTSGDGVLFGVVSNFGAGVVFEFDGQDPLLVRGSAPVDETFPVLAFVVPTSPQLHGRAFVATFVGADGAPVTPIAVRVESLSEEGISRTEVI